MIGKVRFCSGKVRSKVRQRAVLSPCQCGSGAGIHNMKLTDEQIKAADVEGNGEISVEDAQWLLKYYTEKYVAGKDITWDDIFGKITQALPRLIKKRIPSLKLR